MQDGNRKLEKAKHVVKVGKQGLVTLDFGKILVDVVAGGGAPECTDEVTEFRISIRPGRSAPECTD